MGIISSITKAVSNWFHGTYVLYDNPPDSSVFIVGGYVERHWTASTLAAIGRFISAEWKWLIGIIIAIFIAYANFLLKR